MRENRYDKILAKMTNRIERVSDKMAREFKNTNPFDQERIPDNERIMTYFDFLDNPEVEQEWRMTAGDAAIDKYHLDMRELINRRMMRNA